METLLVYVAYTLNYWSGFLLMWGVAIGIEYWFQLRSHINERRCSTCQSNNIMSCKVIRTSDKACFGLTWALNLILVLYFTYIDTASSFPSVLVILDVWGTLLLAYVTCIVIKWSRNSDESKLLPW